MTSALGAGGGKPGIRANSRSNPELDPNRCSNSVQRQATTPLGRGCRGALAQVIL